MEDHFGRPVLNGRLLVILAVAYFVALIAMVLVVGASIVFLCKALRRYITFRRPREICCPETNQLAIVHIKALRPSLTSFWGNPTLQVSACSQWPERLNCDRACLPVLNGALRIQ